MALPITTIFPFGRDPILADVDAGADAVRGDPDETVVRGRIDADPATQEVGRYDGDEEKTPAIGGADEDSVFLARLNAWMTKCPGAMRRCVALGNDAIADVNGGNGDD